MIFQRWKAINKLTNKDKVEVFKIALTSLSEL